MEHGRLELEQDPTFQKREWRLQRFAWVLWALLILAALAGFLGPGPFSEREAVSSDGRVTVAYNRFVHHHHPRTLEVTMQPEDENDDSLRLQLSQSLLEDIQVERIEPEPTSRELSAGGTWYEFRCEPGVANAKVIFHIEYDSMGSGSGKLHLAGSQPVEINYFVYP